MNTNMMTLSIITPTIQARKKYLERLVKILKNLKRPPNIKIEHIIIDQDKSAGQQRNIGILQSTGDYILFLDDDDIILYNFFCNTILKMMTNRYKLIFFKSERYYQPNENNIMELIPDSYAWEVGNTFKSIVHLNNHLQDYNPFPVGSYLIHSSLKHIEWPEGYFFGEDLLYNRQLTKEVIPHDNNIHYIGNTKTIIVRHEKSTTSMDKNMLWHKKR